MTTNRSIFFEDVEIGDDIGPLEIVITTDQVRDFVEIWGDVTEPTRFTDKTIALGEGLPGPIVPGALNIAILSKLLTDWSNTVRIKTLDVIFRGMVYHDICLTIQGIITDAQDLGEEALLECDVFIRDQEDIRLVIGKAVIVIPTREANAVGQR